MEKKIVVYSVAGEGHGHAARAVAIIEQFKGALDVYFMCGGKAYNLLKPLGYKLIKIPHLGFVFENDSINQWKTFKQNLKLFFNRNKIYREIEGDLKSIKPDFVISDFEYFVPRAANRLKIPVIQISHQHVLIACHYPVPLNQFFDFLKAYIVSRLIITTSQFEIGISFFKLQLIKKYTKINLQIFPPLLRKEIATVQKNIHCDKILVYFSCETFAWVMKVLEQIDESFVVYGIENKAYTRKNIEFKPISPTTFIEDLKGCKAIITNGGHTLVAEAIHLNKPVFAFYVKGQFEQYLNSYYLDKLNYGRCIKSEANALAEITQFLNDVPAIAKHLATVDICGNDIVHQYLRSVIFKESHDNKMS